MVEKAKKVGARHGKSLGKCMKCGAEFSLRKHTKHRAGLVVRNAICRSCNEKIIKNLKKEKEVEKK